MRQHMDNRVRITIDDNGVADVALVRSDKMNALDAEMFAALADAIQRLKAEPKLRAVVLHGEGKAFCAGLIPSSGWSRWARCVPVRSTRTSGSWETRRGS